MSSRKKYIFFLTTLVLVVGVGIGSYAVTDSRNSKKEMEELASIAYSTEKNAKEYIAENDSTVTTKVSSGTVTKDNASAYKTSLDVEGLQKANPDIAAWITVPGTLIDYPIAQHPTDDLYYLSHGPEGLKSSHGCPYIEICDSNSFQDNITVVYGHNMNDGSMFAGLHKFEDSKFLKDHREITVTTVDHVMTYKIFAAVMYSDAYIPYYFDDTKKADRTAFVKSLETDIVKKRSIILNDEKVTDANKIIVLSTCDKKLRSNRFLVVAVLKQIDGVDV
ncbi:class B sortase [Butyrivibrio sp. VCB2006]|uniref:class B sortase n=1 Tax=Butyrivibrio sp. VCB2006 TaxID=1280679 RepID=UPI0004199799|nr:class B sortase [Butyrivibrio sp. VCB2006]